MQSPQVRQVDVENSLLSEIEEIQSALTLQDFQRIPSLLERLGQKSIPSFPSCCSSPLHIAAWHGFTYLVEPLLQLGCKWDSVDEFLWSPLHAAAYNGQTEFILQHMNHFSSVDILDESECTPLMAAARQGHSATTMLLLQHGANPARRDLYQKGAWNYAADGGFVDLAIKLRELADGMGLQSPLASEHQGHISVEILNENTDPLQKSSSTKDQRQNAAISTAVIRKSQRASRPVEVQPMHEFPIESKPVFLALVSVAQITLLILLLQRGGITSLSENPTLGPQLDVVVSFGARDMRRIKQGHWWRWFTSIFVHAGIFHLVANMFVQWKVCRHLEQRYGSFKFGALYILGGLFSTVLSALLQPDTASLGSSGAIYATFAIIFVDLVKNWSMIVEPFRIFVGYSTVMILSLAVGLLPMVDNFAHIGGYIGGLLISWAVVRDIRKSDRIIGKIFRLLAIACYLAIMIYAVMWLYQNPNDAVFCSWCRFLDCIPVKDWCDV